jgi:pimeloyl-ACP methyl ester carboxylesterase
VNHRWLWPAVVGGAAAVALAIGGSGALTLVAARRVVIPPRKRSDDTRIIWVDRDESSIILSRTAESIVPGVYGFWFSGGTGYAWLGDVVAETAASVTRRIIDVRYGNLAGATRGRFTGWFYLSPTDLEAELGKAELGKAELGTVEFENVDIATELGPAPAWLVPAPTPSGRWVIQVHGRAVQREEALRAVPVFREAGYTSLLVSYRNDGDAPRSRDYRYGLGDTEWHDVDAALTFAIDHGATDVVLMGWSMGGATVLQVVTRSSNAGVVRGVVLESPVVDWVSALRHQIRLRRLPSLVHLGVIELIGKSWSRWLTGQQAPIDLARLNFVSRAAELDLPILLMHSAADDFVPDTASRQLAEARPDIVTFDQFVVAGHTRLWNYDRERWDSSITAWLWGLGGSER